MNRLLHALAVLTLAGASPVAAQDVRVSLRLGDGPIHVAGYYASRPQYAIPARFYCEPDGPFLYCWDERAYLVERPVVYVYPANRRFVVVERHYRWDRDGRKWRKEAVKALRRWRKQHRFRDGNVRVVLAWER